MTNPLNEGFLRQHQLAVALHKAGELVRSELDVHLSAFTVNFLQLSMLIAIAKGAAHSPAGIARRLDVDPAVVTRALDKLEALGFVQRTRSQEDRRSVSVSLTDRGLLILDQMCDVASNVLSLRLSHLTNEQFDCLNSLLALTLR